MAQRNLDAAAVVLAAADLADRSGVEALTMSAVARQIGIQPASLYFHVRDHAALLDGIQQLALSELADAIGNEIAGRSGHDALVGLAEAHRRFADAHPGRWASLLRPAASATAESAGATRVARLNWAVLRGYALADDELVHATRFVGATINGFLTLERAGGFAHRQQGTEQSWARTLSAIDVALRAWPSGNASDKNPCDSAGGTK